MDGTLLMISQGIIGFDTGASELPAGFRVPAGYEQVTVGVQSDIGPHLAVYTRHGSKTQSFWDSNRLLAIYIWGQPVHPDCSSQMLPNWLLDSAQSGDWNNLHGMLGTFVCVIEDRIRKRIHYISDILGIRPAYLVDNNGHTVFGDDVWTLHEAGLTSSAVDYNAVASWLMYGYNCASESLFSSCARLSPGTVTTIGNNRRHTYLYTRLVPDDHTSNVAETIHDIVSRAARLLYSRHPLLVISLSGGFDSRYLLALARQLATAELRVAHVIHYRESSIAERVAKALDLPLQIIHGGIKDVDLYDEPFHFSADGFPIGKQQTFLSAELNPGLPLINGFLGDSLVRGHHDTCFGLSEDQHKEPLPLVLQRYHATGRLDLYDRRIANNVVARSLVPMEAACEAGADSGSIFNWADLYYRQRRFISNNFLQHLLLSEALVPFYSWELINFKSVNPNKLFGWETYRRIFEMNFPDLASIPHSSQLALNRPRSGRIQHSRRIRKWAQDLFRIAMGHDNLNLLDKRKVLPRLAAGVLDQNQEHVVLLVKRLALLEERTRIAGVDLDWRAL